MKASSHYILFISIATTVASLLDSNLDTQRVLEYYCNFFGTSLNACLNRQKNQNIHYCV